MPVILNDPDYCRRMFKQEILGTFVEDVDRREFPHICTWAEIGPELANPKHQKQLLRGKKLYQCPDYECRQTIWLKHKPLSFLGMNEIYRNILGADLDSQIHDLRMQNWDKKTLKYYEEQLRTK